MKNSLIHPKLAHLTVEEIEILVHEYFADVKVDVLIDRFNIPCTRGQFFKLLPPKPSGEICPKCAMEMLSPTPSKSAALFLSEKQLYCPKCLHEPQISEKKRNLLDIRPKQPVDAKRPKLGLHKHLCSNDLTVEQAITLQAIMTYSASNMRVMDIRYISESRSVPLAPTFEYAKQLTLNLEQAGLLRAVEQKKNHAASSLKIKNKFNLLGSQYTITEAVTQELIEDVQHRLLTLDWPDRWHDEICSVIVDLAFAEIKEFYKLCIKERNFPEANEALVSNLIINLLQDFSVAQCFHIIYRGAQAASDFIVKNNAYQFDAINYMLATSQNYADRARASNRNLFAFRRNWKCPRSLMSIILYDDVLKMRDEGITTPILKVVA